MDLRVLGFTLLVAGAFLGALPLFWLTVLTLISVMAASVLLIVVRKAPSGTSGGLGAASLTLLIFFALFTPAWLVYVIR